MSKTTKTEKLIDKLIGILDAGDLMLNPPEDMVEFIDKGAIKLCRLDQLLKACKEAGMEFVDREAERGGILVPVISLGKIIGWRMPTEYEEILLNSMVKANWHKTEGIEI